jgi:hypothetical protein
MEKFVVSHRLFVTNEQRETLNKGQSVVETTGVFASVLMDGTKTNEPANEVFANYRIYSCQELPDKPVLSNETGWRIYLERKHVRQLSQCGFLPTGNTDIVKIDEKQYPVVHQIVISDLSELEKTMYCIHLPQIASK